MLLLGQAVKRWGLHTLPSASAVQLPSAGDSVRLADVAWTEVQAVPAEATQEEVARVISDYDLVAVPV